MVRWLVGLFSLCSEGGRWPVPGRRGIAGFLIRAFPSPPRPPLVADTTPALGRALVGPFAVTFELLALLLVVALLGALYFARTDE